MTQLSPSGGDEPPVYRWLPDTPVITPGDASGWLPPEGPIRPLQPPQHSPTAPRQQRRRREGAAGGILAAIFAFLKYGLVLVKFGTFGPTLITMLIAVWFYTLFFGPAFAVGIVVLILVHELGHFIVARGMGLPARLPIFVGPLGAFTNLRRAPADAGKSGIIALAGPALGTVAALLCFLLASTAPAGYARYLLLALAYFGCFLNLINLIPVGFLDGAKVADVIPKWMNVAGLLVVAARRAPLRQSDRADLPRPRHLPHRRTISPVEPGRPCAAGRVKTSRARRRVHRHPPGRGRRHVGGEHRHRQQQLRPRRQPQHRQQRPLGRQRAGVGVGVAVAWQSGKGNVIELYRSANTSSWSLVW